MDTIDAWLAKSPIVTREEAMSYLRINSARTFARRAKEWRLSPIQAGRYSRRDVERVAERAAK